MKSKGKRESHLKRKDTEVKDTLLELIGKNDWSYGHVQGMSKGVQKCREGEGIEKPRTSWNKISEKRKRARLTGT